MLLAILLPVLYIIIPLLYSVPMISICDTQLRCYVCQSLSYKLLIVEVNSEVLK